MSELQELVNLHQQAKERVLTLQKHLRLAATKAKKEEIAEQIKEAKSRLADLEEQKSKMGL